MPTGYGSYEPDQVMLLPAALQDWLPAVHLTHFINDTVDALDLKAFYARYEGGGSRNQPLHPAMMVKVLVYAYAGACSARARLSGGCMRIWRFGCSLRATSRATARLRLQGVSPQSLQPLAIMGFDPHRRVQAEPGDVGAQRLARRVLA